MMTADKDYRSDVDGLRAVAVAAIVLYHAGVPGTSGGFVGVDIFFVISGYLITRILAREIGEGRFSLAAFYERRARRILPALFVMLAASAVAASLIELPAEFEEFGGSLAAATLFASNVFFWQTADYFAAPAHLKPLLHTWSLAVEEQYYLVFPLLLMAIARHGRGRPLVWLVPLTALSLGLSIWATHAHPNAAFYLLPTRFWELMVGALLALGLVPEIPSRRWRTVGATLGLALIAGSVVFYSSATVFPGLAALLPCLGAALILHAGSDGARETWVGRLLSQRPIVFVGFISYSLYLWHWPVLVFARQWRGEPPGAAETALLVILSVVLAVLSWSIVERPFREQRVAAGRPALVRGAVAAMAALVIVGLFADRSGGWPARHDGYAPPPIAGLDHMRLATCFLDVDQSPEKWAGETACQTGLPGLPVVVLWGDSFAAHLAPGLGEEAARRFQFVQYTASGCPPILDVAIANRPHCRAFNDRARDLVARLKPAAVIISARWDLYMPRAASAETVTATVERIEALGTRVLVVGNSPVFDFANPYDFVYRNGRSEARSTEAPALRTDATQSAAGGNVFDPMPLFCSDGRCRLQENGDYLFFDGGHYSLTGSRLVARALLPRLAGAIDSLQLRTSAAMRIAR